MIISDSKEKIKILKIVDFLINFIFYFKIFYYYNFTK